MNKKKLCRTSVSCSDKKLTMGMCDINDDDDQELGAKHAKGQKVTLFSNPEPRFFFYVSAIHLKNLINVFL